LKYKTNSKTPFKFGWVSLNLDARREKIWGERKSIAIANYYARVTSLKVPPLGGSKIMTVDCFWLTNKVTCAT